MSKEKRLLAPVDPSFHALAAMEAWARLLEMRSEKQPLVVRMFEQGGAMEARDRCLSFGEKFADLFDGLEIYEGYFDSWDFDLLPETMERLVNEGVEPTGASMTDIARVWRAVFEKYGFPDALERVDVFLGEEALIAQDPAPHLSRETGVSL